MSYYPIIPHPARVVTVLLGGVKLILAHGPHTTQMRSQVGQINKTTAITSYQLQNLQLFISSSVSKHK